MFIWTVKERATLNGAIEKHGMLHQSMKLAEELGELQQALMKLWEPSSDRDRTELPDAEERFALTDHLAEEIADTLIMIEQQVMMWDLGKEVSRWKDVKLALLREAL